MKSQGIDQQVWDLQDILLSIRYPRLRQNLLSFRGKEAVQEDSPSMAPGFLA